MLLLPWCRKQGLLCPSATTIGRLISDAPDRMRCSLQRLDRKGQANPLRRKPPRPRLNSKAGARHVGHCVAFDTIIRFIEGSRRYIPTATDHSSHFAFAAAVPRGNSAQAARFVALVQTVLPGKIEQVSTDNSSEFQGAFNQYLRQRKIRHCYTYPGAPR